MAECTSIAAARIAFVVSSLIIVAWFRNHEAEEHLLHRTMHLLRALCVLRGDLSAPIPPIHLHVEVPHVEGVLLDEVAAGFYLIPHQHPEQFVGCASVFHLHLQQRAVGGVERRVA